MRPAYLTLAHLVGSVVLGPAGPLAAQGDPLPPLDDFHARVFTVADGLPSSDIIDIAQGSDGYLYIAGGRGLLRFDGYGFEPVPLEGFTSRFLREIELGPEGRLWILGRENDVGVLDGDGFRPLPPPPGRVLAMPRSSSAPGWLGTEVGLVRIQLGPEPRYRLYTTADGLPSDSVSEVIEVAGGERVAVTPSRLVRIHGTAGDGVRFEPFGPALDLPLGSLGWGRHVDRHGRLWLAATDGIVRYDGHTFERRSGPTPLDPDEIPLPAPGRAIPLRLAMGMEVPEAAGIDGSAQVFHVLTDRSGDRWFLVRSSRLTRFLLLRERDGLVERVDLQAHLGHRSISALAEDHEGNLWVGTDRGLIQLTAQRVAGLTAEHGLASEFTTAVLQDDVGALWIGSWGGGLHRFAGGRLDRRYTMRDGLPHDRIRALHRSRAGDLWVGGASGFARLVDGEIADVHVTTRVVRAFAETRDGRLWVAAGDTLLVGDGRRFTAFHPDLPWGPELWALEAAHDGAIWVGGRGVLARIASDSVAWFGPEQGLRGTHVSSIHEEPDGTLWIGTYEHGLHRVRGDRFVPITTAHGLPSDGVWRMLRDDRGFVWLSSDVGIFRVAHRELHGVADALERDPHAEVALEPLVFTEAQGSPSRESNRASPGGWRLADGRLVFNNIAGAVVLDPERAARPPPPPRTRIRRVAADGAALPIRSAEPVRLTAGVRQVTFEFAALSFATPAQNRYRYRLDGYDDDWVDGEGRRRAAYTGLDPGRYLFRVQGATGAGPWSDLEASYAFVIPAFFWQTWWFRGLLVGIALAGLGLAHRARVAHLLEVERLRLRIANDLHDDVGSSLSSIALLSEMLREGSTPPELARRQLARIGEAAGETMKALREIIWLVDPEHDNTTDLVERMRRTAGSLLGGVEFEFTPTSLQERRPLDPSFVRQVFLIYKEALHNVARHARATRVRIHVSISDDSGDFSLRVEDDGIGFCDDRVDPGHGLASMRARARELGGELVIAPAEGGGTRLTFRARMA